MIGFFFMFWLSLIDGKYEVGAIYIRCINCRKKTDLYLINSKFEDLITKFVFNVILHYVGMLWIICSNEKMRYEIY